MSLSTLYESYLINWSYKTFNEPLMESLFPGCSKRLFKEDETIEQAEIIYAKYRPIEDFLRFFADPRCIHHGIHIVAVKPEFFPDFQKWYAEKGIIIEKPETVISMPNFVGQKFSIETIKEILKQRPLL